MKNSMITYSCSQCGKALSGIAEPCAKVNARGPLNGWWIKASVKSGGDVELGPHYTTTRSGTCLSARLKVALDLERFLDEEIDKLVKQRPPDDAQSRSIDRQVQRLEEIRRCVQQDVQDVRAAMSKQARSRVTDGD